MLMMPIDTGNKAIKTEHFEFHSGISVLEDIPGEGEEAVKYKGRYYRLSPERNVYLPDKSVDERYYILTLFAIAKELRELKPPRLFLPGEVLKMELVVGLPPLYYRGQYKGFREYFYRGGEPVDFEYMGMSYRIAFSDVFVHMQTYAAYLYVARDLNLFQKKVLLLDIGGFTLDYMLLEKGLISWEYTDSTNRGVISMYQRINKGIREKYDLDLKENDMDAIILGKTSMYDRGIEDRVIELAKEHMSDALGVLRECGIDLRLVVTVFVGGGSILLSNLIDKIWERYQGEYYIISDSKVNVLGYKKKYLYDKSIH